MQRDLIKLTEPRNELHLLRESIPLQRLKHIRNQPRIQFQQGSFADFQHVEIDDNPTALGVQQKRINSRSHGHRLLRLLVERLIGDQVIQKRQPILAGQLDDPALRQIH